MKNKIKVIYKIPEKVNETLDKKITKFIEGLGYKWWAQGYNLEKGERDIAFEMKHRHKFKSKFIKTTGKYLPATQKLAQVCECGYEE